MSLSNISTYDSKASFSALQFVNEKLFALNIYAKCLIWLRGAASSHNWLLRIILVARNDYDDDMEEDDGGWTGLIWSSSWWPQIVTGSSQRVPSTSSLRFAPGRVPIRTLLELIRRRWCLCHCSLCWGCDHDVFAGAGVDLLQGQEFF